MVACPHALASRRAWTSCAPAARRSTPPSPPPPCSRRLPAHDGMGGDAFWLIYDASSARCATSTAAGAPRQRRRSIVSPGSSEIPFRGLVPATLTVPGAVAACARRTRATAACRSRAACGAIHYARDGFPVTARVSRWIEQTADELAADPASARIFLPDGRPAAGRSAPNPDLAQDAGAIAAAGPRRLLRGRECAKGSSPSSADSSRERDLAAQRAHWGEPIRGTYRGVTIYETPPPSQGFTVLQMLEPGRAVRPRPSRSWDRTTSTCWCRPSRSRTTTATACSPIRASRRCPVERLVSKAYADERRAPDRSRARAAVGQACRLRAASRATRCTSPRWTPRATPPR